MYKKIIGLAVLGAILGLGCGRTKYSLVPPRDVQSQSGDNRITLEWSDVDNPYVVSYRIYRNDGPSGYFYFLDETPYNSYVDDNVENGVTYFYAISSVDENGNESDLTDYDIFDTPRPEGYNRRIFSYSNCKDTGGIYSGFDFDMDAPYAKDSAGTDFYYDYTNGGVIYMTEGGYVQDLGPTSSLLDVNWAPENGWNNTHISLQQGHTYAMWTGNNHFAQLRVISLTGDYLVFDYAYQTDEGNHELSINANNKDKSKRR